MDGQSLIELIEDEVYLRPDLVFMVKRVDDGRCVLWGVGQGALEGHVIDASAKEVVAAINDSLLPEGGSEEEGEE